MARSNFPARDVSSWAPINRQPQGCDTTRPNPATPNLPHWTMQGHDVQYGSNESSRDAGGCKFSSSIFCWKKLRKIQEDESKNTKEKHGRYTFVLLAKASPLPFIATRRLAEGEPVNQQCTFHGRIHESIHGRSQSYNNADSQNSNVSCEH